MLYAGIDAHTKYSHITIINESGEIIKSCKVSSDPNSFSQVLSSFNGESLKAVLEAGYCWSPVYDWLDSMSDEVILAHPAKVRAIAEARIKTDKIDSGILAHLLRADLIPQAYAPSPHTRSVKRILRRRLFLIKIRTMVKNRVQSLLTQHSIKRPKTSDLFNKKGTIWLKSIALPEPDQSLLREDLQLIEFLNDRIEATENIIAKLSYDDVEIAYLASIPGIGQFLSVLIRYEVDDISRFNSAKKFASYTGLVPSTYSSGSRTFHGKITKRGNKWLRWALIEAVWPAVRVSPRLRDYYSRIKKKFGSTKARAATARKLAELVWTIWTERRYYEIR